DDEIVTTAGSEDALALHFAKAEGDGLRYVDAWGCWMEYDGTRWRRQSTPAVWNLIRPYVRACAKQLESLPAQRSLLSRSKVAGIEGLARGSLLIPDNAWDANPWQLNTPGGVVDLH